MYCHQFPFQSLMAHAIAGIEFVAISSRRDPTRADFFGLWRRNQLTVTWTPVLDGPVNLKRKFCVGTTMLACDRLIVFSNSKA